MTIFSLITIPLALLETFLGPIIAKIFKIKRNFIFEKFVNKNLINFAFFIFIAFYILKILVFEFLIIDHFFPKYSNNRIIIFSIAYLAFYTFIELYFLWFFNALNKAKIIFKNSVYLFISIFILFIFLKSDLRDFVYYYILSFLVYSLYTVYSFNKIKPSKSFLKLSLINLIVIFDFTIFYFSLTIKYIHTFILVFSIIFYKTQTYFDFFEKFKIKQKLIIILHLIIRLFNLKN